MKTLRIGHTGGDRVVVLSNIDDVRQYIENYSGVMRLKTCLGDLSLISGHAQACLLKFIEESEEDIVCYASVDSVSPVLMSRFDIIDKVDNTAIGVQAFSDYVDDVRNGKISDSNKARGFVAKSAHNLDRYLIFRSLNQGVISRVGMFI
jgi:hypothetical protein